MILKLITYFCSFLLIIPVFSNNTDGRKPFEEYFENYKKANTLDKKIESLSLAAKQKKWPRYPLALFLRSNLYIKKEQTNSSLSDLKLLNKKYKIFSEPWLERIYQKIIQKQYKHAYKLIKKGIKKSSKSIFSLRLNPATLEQKQLLEKHTRLLFLEFKAFSEIMLNKKKKLKKTEKVIIDLAEQLKTKRNLEQNKILNNNIDPNFILSLIHYYNGNINECKKLIFASFDRDWQLESYPFVILVFEKHTNFKFFFLELKKDYLKMRWNKNWNTNRSAWKVSKWKEQYFIFAKKPFLLIK